ncbi:MAG: hypothetical protein JWQ35_2060 [Bacteriovoracaceae bacterium]|nr:hypothetical protein [Bacteriovoracaceae bacterium]
MKVTSLGIDLLNSNPKKYLGKRGSKRVAALCHPSSATRQYKHLVSILEENADLVALFGPQHGIHGETQDNMIEWQDSRDEKARPVHSLYGERRKPTRESLKNIDLVVIDLFDVGARYYTFIYTMAYMLEVCGELGIPVLVCDRPNPLGGKFIEGNILDLRFKSFVGMFALPVCHGMTLGELAQFFCDQLSKKPPLQIIKIKNWKRSQLANETGLTWTLPSPNMPSFDAAVVYPGMCLLEATTLSEGRGTTRPFELIGAPFINWAEVEEEYLKLSRSLKTVPASLHRQGFIPTFHKFKGELCRGALQLVSDPKKFQPLRHAVMILWILRKLYPHKWKWKSPPYEYEYEKLPIDILAGGTDMREIIDKGLPLNKLFKQWQSDEKKFEKIRKPYLLYT